MSYVASGFKEHTFQRGRQTRDSYNGADHEWQQEPYCEELHPKPQTQNRFPRGSWNPSKPSSEGKEECEEDLTMKLQESRV